LAFFVVRSCVVLFRSSIALPGNDISEGPGYQRRASIAHNIDWEILLPSTNRERNFPTSSSLDIALLKSGEEKKGGVVIRLWTFDGGRLRDARPAAAEPDAKREALQAPFSHDSLDRGQIDITLFFSHWLNKKRRAC